MRCHLSRMRHCTQACLRCLVFTTWIVAADKDVACLCLFDDSVCVVPQKKALSNQFVRRPPNDANKTLVSSISLFQREPGIMRNLALSTSREKGQKPSRQRAVLPFEEPSGSYIPSEVGT